MPLGYGIRRNIPTVLKESGIAFATPSGRCSRSYIPTRRPTRIPDVLSYLFKQDEIHNGTHVYFCRAFCLGAASSWLGDREKTCYTNDSSEHLKGNGTGTEATDASYLQAEAYVVPVGEQDGDAFSSQLSTVLIRISV